jgi:sec-independent protein translocase protein TatC
MAVKTSPQQAEHERTGRLRKLGRVTGALRKSHRKASLQLNETLPLLQHLEELRQRVFRALGAVAVTTILSFAFSTQLIDYLTRPVGGRGALVSIEITENVGIFMRVSLLSGLVFGMPFVAYQALRFVLPGITRRERSVVFFGVPAFTLLLAGGVAFAWFVMIPVAVPFLMTFLGITTHPRPTSYFAFITSLMFWIGVSFEMPLVAMLAARFGLLSARQLLAGWRYAIVGIAVMAAVVTPTVDPVNMGLLMLPLMGLYLISIVLAAIGGRH